MNKLKNILQITCMVLVMSVFFSSCKDEEDPVIDAPVLENLSKVTSSGFTVTWKKVTGATQYYLDVATDDKFTSKDKGSFKDKKLGNVETYDIIDLSPNTLYYVRLRAGKDAVRSKSSEVKEITTKKPALAKPTSVAIPTDDITSNSFTVTWTKVPGADEYYLDVATANTFTKSQFVTDFESKKLNNVNTYAVGGLSPNKRYYVRLRASKTGKAQISDYSTSTSATTKTSSTSTRLGRVTRVRVVSGTLKKNDATLQWDVVAGATKYLVDVSKKSSFAALVIPTMQISGGATATALERLTPYTEYHVRVRAQKADNKATTSVDSEPVSFTTKLEEPVISLGEKAPKGFKVSWTAVSGADKYFVDVSPNVFFAGASTKTNIEATGSDKVSHTFTDLDPGTDYWVRVRATKTGEDQVTSDNSPEKKQRTSDPAPSAGKLGKPDNVAVKPGTLKKDEAILKWGAVAGATKYFVEVSKSSAFDSFVGGHAIEVTGGAVETKVTGLEPYTPYHARVRAQKGTDDSTISENSEVSSFTTKLEEPLISLGEKAPKGFKVSWFTITGADKYFVDVATDARFNALAKANIEVAGGSGRIVTHVFTDLAPGTPYRVRVRATKTGEDQVTSDNSPAKQITTAAAPKGGSEEATKVPAPSDLRLSSGLTVINVYWDEVPGVSYEITVATDAEFTALVAGYPKTINGYPSETRVGHSVKKLTSGTTYHVKVVAKKGALVSDPVTGSQKTTPEKPENVRVTLMKKNAIEIEWDPFPKAHAYRVFASAFQNFPKSNYAKVRGTSHYIRFPSGSDIRGTQLYIKVVAIKTAGGESEPTILPAEQTRIPNKDEFVGRPGEIQLEAGTLTSNSFTVTWKRGKHCTEQIILLKKPGGVINLLTKRIGTVERYSFGEDELFPGTEYEVSVTSYNGIQESTARKTRITTPSE